MLTLSAETLKTKTGREKAIFKIVEALRADEVIIAPIDQGYAYLADPNSDLAMAKIKEIKGMDPSVYFALLVNSVSQIQNYCGVISTEQRLLAQQFWPGPLMFECDVLPGLSGSFGADSAPESLYFRYSADPTVSGVCEMFGPLVFSPILDGDKKSIGDLKKLSSAAKKIARYAITGKSRWSKTPSTIVAFSSAGVVIKRIGGITEQQIRALIPQVKVN